MNPAEISHLSVLHIATALTWRGGEQQVAYLVGELAKKNIRQFVFCSRGSAMEGYCNRNAIPYVAVKKRSSFDLSFAANIARFCRKHTIGIMHAHDSHAHTFALAAVVIFHAKAKIIVSRRVDFAIGGSRLARYKYNHPAVKKIVCVSDTIRKIMSTAVEEPSKLVTVHSGIDVSRFTNSTKGDLLHKQYGIPNHYRIVANIAALAPHKDYKTFVDTVSILNEQLTDTIFLVIGEGPERETIGNYLRQKGLNSKIIMTGFRTDIAAILPEIDLMLITSETEGLGTAILDAFASKVPVVATAAGGIPEIVIHEQTGLLASVKDPKGLSIQVMRMLRDHELREKLIAGATRHLMDFTTESTAVKTLKEYLAISGLSL